MLNSILIEGTVERIFTEQDGDRVVLQISHRSMKNAYEPFDVLVVADGALARSVAEKVNPGMTARAVGRLLLGGFPRVQLQHLETGGAEDMPVRGSA